MFDINKPQAITVDVLQEKYCKGEEKTDIEIFARTAKGIASVEKSKAKRSHWEKLFFENMKRGAIGGGRIMGAAGTDIKATLINCFIQPVSDSIQDYDEDGLPGIYIALREAAETMRRGGGVGYDFSRIRPRNAFVKGTNSFASGPCSYMDVFDMSCKTVESAGSRRGAQMGVLRIDHPDVEEYIVAKRTEGRWNNFNVSVYVSDEFIDAVRNDKDWELIHKATPSDRSIEAGAFKRKDGMWVYKTLRARELWDTIMRSNYDFAEPGILFENNINKVNNLRYAEYIAATNPCGEQPLPYYGCCDLGPIILTKFVKNPFTPEAYFDYESLEETVEIQVRFLDNVLDATHWPLEQQKKEAESKRRIGIGFTGLGNALAMLNIKYSGAHGCQTAAKISEVMRNAAYKASVELAKEKGPFPLFDAEKYLEEGTFASQLPEEIKNNIRTFGIRNSHLLSIAPTGTVSLAFADNASNGIEPPFSLAYERKKRDPEKGFTTFIVLDHSVRVALSLMEDTELASKIEKALATGLKEIEHNSQKLVVRELLPKSIITALELTTDQHLAMMQAVQPFIDSAISKTVNVPADCPFEDFKNIYMKAFDMGLKGVSTYRPNNILGSVLSEIKTETTDCKAVEGPVITTEEAIDEFLNTIIEKRTDIEYDAVNKKVTYLGPEGNERFFVSISLDSDIFVDGDDKIEIYRPLEVFITATPDSVPSEWVDIFSLNLSLLARSGFNMFCKALRNCRKVKSDKGKIRYGWYEKYDGSRVPRYHESNIACIAYVIQEILKKRGMLDDNGYPIRYKARLDKKQEPKAEKENNSNSVVLGKTCSECGAAAVIRKDGCNFCTNCGAQGSCG